MIANIKRKELFNIFILSIVIIVINVNSLIINGYISKFSNEIERIRIKHLTKEYLEDQSEHFVYRYTNSDKDNIPMISRIAETGYSKLSKTFKYESNEKIEIVVFPDIKSMNTTLNLPKDQKSMGLYYSGFISILSPKVWIHEKNIQKIESILFNSGPIVHELAHYFVDKKSNGNYPIWFTEGAALYFEKQITGFEWGKDSDYTEDPYTIEQLTYNFDKLDFNRAYRRSYEIVSNYVDKNGVEELLNIMTKLGEGYLLEEFGN